ncbi:DISP complex protein LRCH3 isoform X3 [Gadus macrocephalus]|uniref:DISP complex protein LRCH3 isoform X3 n=1 Tax=Gadus macrocephalus TaxID=80720 RepID=UPI0028CB44C4|nr:DISP complex protein LRCH3 isoform X3 [Gadus macrocephalus]
MAAGDGAQLPATIAASRSVEKALEEASASGALNLSNRKLKEFPRTARNYDLSDVTHADLSKNCLCELPEELCHFISLETLSLYHNGMRSLSSGLGNLQALTYLNLSRNLLSTLPPAVFQLPLLRVLIVSNNKLSSLPASIHTLTHLRQLDASCNDLQALPAELGQLDSLRDLSLRRNQLTSLPEEISELPLVRLDLSCNRISHVPVCYRHLRHLQSFLLDSNPLQLPPAQVCSKGKYHIFKYLNMEACRRNQEELERHMRPTGFTSCLSDHELFSGQFGGLDSGFNSVDSGSKRWSGNESADDFSERSLRVAEVGRDQKNLAEEEEEEEAEAPSRPGAPAGRLLAPLPPVNGEAEQVDFIDSSVTAEEEEDEDNLPTPTLVSVSLMEKKEALSASQTQDSAASCSLLKSSAKTGNHVASTLQTGNGTGGVQENSHPPGLRQRCASAEQMSAIHPATPIQRSASRTDMPSSPKTSPPGGLTQKPNSFLFRATSRGNVKPNGSFQNLGESGRSDSRTTLRGPREERPDVSKLRKTLESRLKVTLPEDLGEALSNGTVLCQLANQIRPRSVAIIHVPSPAVPKLSSAKCRLNVENFITACRKLGVPETEVCVCSDVFLCKLPAVLRSVAAMLAAAARQEGGGLEEEEGEGERPEPADGAAALPSSSPSGCSSPPPSLLSPGFLLFYCLLMVALYALYRLLV